MANEVGEGGPCRTERATLNDDTVPFGAASATNLGYAANAAGLGGANPPVVCHTVVRIGSSRRPSSA